MGLQDVDDDKIKERELKVMMRAKLGQFKKAASTSFTLFDNIAMMAIAVMRNLAPGDFAAVKKRLNQNLETPIEYDVLWTDVARADLDDIMALMPL